MPVLVHGRIPRAVPHAVTDALAVSTFGAGAVAADPGLRARAKRALLAQFYGQGTRSLAAELGIAAGEAEAMRRKIHGRYKVLAGWAKAEQVAAKRGDPRLTLMGRPLPALEDASHRAVNHRVQATAADLFHSATSRVAAITGADALWLGVHDELILQVPQGAEAPAMAALVEAMCSDFEGVHNGGTPTLLGPAWRKA